MPRDFEGLDGMPTHIIAIKMNALFNNNMLFRTEIPNDRKERIRFQYSLNPKQTTISRILNQIEDEKAKK